MNLCNGGELCMKILFISDWHNHQYNLPEIEVDLLICLGDFDWRIIEKIDKAFNCPKIGLLGNHDRKDTYRGTSFIHLHKKVAKFGDYLIAGFDGCPKYNTRETAQYEEEEVEEFMETLEDVDIFIAHANPMLEKNKDKTDAHRGFQSFTKYIKAYQPSYFVHGHNHVDETNRLDRTEIISVYPYYLLEL